MARKISYLVGLIFASTLFGTSAHAALVSATFSGNDCAGYFGTGFGSCAIFIDVNRTHIEISPVIHKVDYNDDNSVANTETNSMFPSVDGSEFTISDDVNGDDNATGTWSYTPTGADPGVRYWAVKAGSSFTLYWDVDVSLTQTGGACDGTNNYNLTCLNAANVVSSGSWTTPNNQQLSHITFYDSEPPQIVPIPAAVWLFGSALLGLVGIGRRKATLKAKIAA